MKQIYFSYFWCGFKIKTSVYAWRCDEQLRTCEEHLRTFKHIQENLNNYYHTLILNYHYDNTKNKLEKRIIPSCNIHTVEEETLGRGSKGGEKKELWEKEWVSLNTLSLRKTKIWQDYSTSLELKRGEARGFFVCFGMKKMRGLYSSGGENMNGRPFNKGWQRIMNLDLILALREILCIKWKDWWEWGTSQVWFSRSCCNNL